MIHTMKEFYQMEYYEALIARTQKNDIHTLSEYVTETFHYLFF